MSDAPLAFHLNPPDVHADRCLNARHKQAGCSLCVQHCPVEAISLLPGAQPLPLLDEQTCIGCGVCIRVCPTDAFSQTFHAETKLIILQEEFPPDEGLALVCPQHLTPERIPAPVRYAIRHQRCLAAFSPEHLLSLSRDGEREIWLGDDACSDCPIGRLQEDIVENVAAATRILAGFGLAPAIHLLTESDASPRQVRVLDGSAMAVSRRGFFRSLGKLTQQRADEAADRTPKPLFTPGAPVDQRLPYQTPPSLQRLNQHLASMGRQTPPDPAFTLETDGLPWASVQVDETACSGCQLCARFCPTGALNFLWGEVDGDLVFNLTFHPALCLLTPHLASSPRLPVPQGLGCS